jgi:mycothiol synthase
MSTDDFQQVAPDELRPALAYLLAPPGAGLSSTRRLVEGFCQYLEQCPVQHEALRCGPARKPTGLFFSMLLPGATAIVMTPVPGEHGILPDDQLRVSQAAMQQLAPRGLHYAQALLEPESEAKSDLFDALGFRPLGPLLYLERDARYPWTDPPPPGELEWVRYSQATRPLFESTVLETYEGSLDCPELAGLRPIGDVLAAHQATGRFDPALWEVARREGQAAGCLLLAELPHFPALEVAYMGVVPRFRRSGIGGLLLRRALEQCRAVGARQLTVVVDDRNKPARSLYAQLGLKPITRRDARIYTWCRAGGQPGQGPVDNL